MARLQPSPWAELSGRLWHRWATHGILQAHVLHQRGVDGVEVSVLEASTPLVYQARALSDALDGQLVLVPFAPGELLSTLPMATRSSAHGPCAPTSL